MTVSGSEPLTRIGNRIRPLSDSTGMATGAVRRAGVTSSLRATAA